MRVVVTARASDELASALEYLSSVNPHAARRTGAAVRDAIRSLRQFPNRGRATVAERGWRELLVRKTPYAIIYRVADDVIYVLRIRHIRQGPDG